MMTYKQSLVLEYFEKNVSGSMCTIPSNLKKIHHSTIRSLIQKKVFTLIKKEKKAYVVELTEKIKGIPHKEVIEKIMNGTTKTGKPYSINTKLAKIRDYKKTLSTFQAQTVAEYVERVYTDIYKEKNESYRLKVKTQLSQKVIVKISDLNNLITGLSFTKDRYDLLLFLCACTGRRFDELIRKQFTIDIDGENLVIDELSKQKAGRKVSLSFPVLYSTPSKILEQIKRLKDLFSIEIKGKFSNVELNKKIAKPLSRKIQKHSLSTYGGIVDGKLQQTKYMLKPYDLRHFYAHSYTKNLPEIEKLNTDNSIIFGRILGHSENDQNTQFSYKKFELYEDKFE